MIKFTGMLVVVEDIARSRAFYEHVLGQRPLMDFGANVEYEGHFSIHLKSLHQETIGDRPILTKPNDTELYFEAEELEALQQRLQQHGVEFVHELREQPWGTLSMRFYDPDGHLLEIGEPMDVTARRLHRSGITVEQIIQKTGLPQDYILAALSA
jgi:catechol 2,3-dioxygenase-like lactoylglutathione lyase family enzyme